jgi:adenylate cyclase
MSQSSYNQAVSLFRQSIALDPELSLGYIGLARILYTGTVYGWSSEPARDLVEARKMAKIAISLDPRDSYGHFALSGSSLYLGLHEEALDEARKVIAHNPNFAFGHFRLGQVLTYLGRPAEAVSPIERSIRHSPYDPQLGAMQAQLALAHYHAGNYEDSARHARAAILLHYPLAFGVLAASLARLGRMDQARDAIVAFIPELRQQLKSGTLRLAPYANAADQEHLSEGLRLAAPTPYGQNMHRQRVGL